MFEVGDKVRIVISPYDEVDVGKVAIVMSGAQVPGDNTLMVATDVSIAPHTFTGSGGFHACFFDYELEWVE